jgi:hypothetical protein
LPVEELTVVDAANAVDAVTIVRRKMILFMMVAFI